MQLLRLWHRHDGLDYGDDEELQHQALLQQRGERLKVLAGKVEVSWGQGEGLQHVAKLVVVVLQGLEGRVRGVLRLILSGLVF